MKPGVAKKDRKEYMREYAKEWRKRNPGKNAEIQKRYWANRLAKGSGEQANA